VEVRLLRDPAAERDLLDEGGAEPDRQAVSICATMFWVQGETGVDRGPDVMDRKRPRVGRS